MQFHNYYPKKNIYSRSCERMSNEICTNDAEMCGLESFFTLYVRHSLFSLSPFYTQLLLWMQSQIFYCAICWAEFQFFFSRMRKMGNIFTLANNFHTAISSNMENAYFLSKLWQKNNRKYCFQFNIVHLAQF